MKKIDTFVINYNPKARTVKFAVIKSTGICTDLPDDEPLKDYENNDGLFSLHGDSEKVFEFIKENFDGQTEISLQLKVPNKEMREYKNEFNRFQEQVDKFNKKSDIKVSLSINAEEDSTDRKSCPSNKNENSDSIRHDVPNVQNEPKKTADYIPKKEAPAPKQSDSISNDTAAPAEQAPEPRIAVPAVKPTVKIAVAGKIDSGKTELIKGITQYNNSSCQMTSGIGYSVYSDTKNNVIWYEIDGIGYTEHNNIYKVVDTLEKLIDGGIDSIIYCLSGKTLKIEPAELDFIVNTGRRHPNINVCGVITQSFAEDQAPEFSERVSKVSKNTKMFTVLATDMRTKIGYIEAHGLDKINYFLFGES